MTKRNDEKMQHDATEMPATKELHQLQQLSDDILAEITGGMGNVEVKLVDTDLTCGSYNF